MRRFELYSGCVPTVIPRCVYRNLKPLLRRGGFDVEDTTERRAFEAIKYDERIPAVTSSFGYLGPDPLVMWSPPSAHSRAWLEIERALSACGCDVSCNSDEIFRCRSVDGELADLVNDWSARMSACDIELSHGPTLDPTTGENLSYVAIERTAIYWSPSALLQRRRIVNATVKEMESHGLLRLDRRRPHALLRPELLRRALPQELHHALFSVLAEEGVVVEDDDVVPNAKMLSMGRERVWMWRSVQSDHPDVIWCDLAPSPDLMSIIGRMIDDKLSGESKVAI